jgi:cation/acetate symporter
MAAESLLGVALPDLPTWSQLLKQLGLITLPANSFDTAIGQAQRVTFQRDTLALMLPVAAELPRVFLGLVVAAVLAAGSASASAQLAALGSMASDDIYCAAVNRGASPSRRLLVARLAMIVAGIAVLVLIAPGGVDPLRWVLTAFSLSAGAFFAPLVLAIWWRRLSAKAAITALIAGVGLAAYYVSTGEAHFLGGDALTAGAAGTVASACVAVVVTLFAGKATDLALEAVDELRIPAGETLQSRMLRLAARAKPARP